MDYEKEISFGAFDSELMHQEIFIPKGFEATIEDDKIILTRKDSEDERIRNEIIAFVEQSIHRGGGTPIPQEQEDRWIAWLEKQATPQMVEDAFLKGCNDTKKSLLKKQGKQKSVGEEIVEALRAEYKKGRAEAFAEMQKKWSDEDEERIKNILSVLDVQVCWNGATGKKENPYQKEIDWLKSLKDRAQPKQELSEEDDDAAWMNDIISKVENNLQLNKAEIDWLKSLKERITWKPSDDQMKALADALSLAKNCGEEGAFDLRTLYEQLEKLKGE